MLIPHSDPRLSWSGAVSLEQTADHTRPWRLPFDERGLFHEGLVVRAGMPAGVRLAFRSSTRAVRGRVRPSAEAARIDLFIEGDFVGGRDLAGRAEFAFDDLAAGEKTFEFWLPQFGEFALQSIEVEDGATFAATAPDTRPKWVTHGSSITQCRTAASPSRTWPSIVARERGLDLTALGYGGQCHLDIEVARMMRELPVDYLSVCAGINIYGAGSLNARSFGPALTGFVRILRERHPRAPLLVISPIFGCHRETTPNQAGWTLHDYRQVVEATVRTLREHGDEAVRYLDGRELFDADLAHHLPDQLHPDAEGYELMAQNFLRRAAPLLFDRG